MRIIINSKILKFNPQVRFILYDNKSQNDDEYNNNETILSEVSVHPSVNTSTYLNKYSEDCSYRFENRSVVKGNRHI